MAAGRGSSFDSGPSACPFVALELDRDRRSERPDYRHRCYAEQVPAPRTIAHQEAYCLSPNFSRLPHLPDWALRAAARPVPLPPGYEGRNTPPDPRATLAGAGAGAADSWRRCRTPSQVWPDSMDNGQSRLSPMLRPTSSSRRSTQGSRCRLRRCRPLRSPSRLMLRHWRRLCRQPRAAPAEPQASTRFRSPRMRRSRPSSPVVHRARSRPPEPAGSPRHGAMKSFRRGS